MSEITEISKVYPKAAACRHCREPLVIDYMASGDWVHRATGRRECARQYVGDQKVATPMVGVVLVTHEFAAHDEDRRYCLFCGKPEQRIKLPDGNRLISGCKCKKSKTWVPHGAVFVFDEREDVNLRAVMDRAEFQHITVCDFCQRPALKRDDTYWKCHCCGNENRDKRSVLKIPKGLVLTWAEQRVEIECEVAV